MTTRWGWILTRVMRRLWVRATLIGILGVATAVLAAVIQRYVPWEIPGSIRADAVDSILAIIASSMLTVTTFSLSVMVSAYGSATSNVTPRATRLLMEDRVTQNVLSTFIGSFLFSIVGIVVLKTGAYGDRGRVILFLVTIGIIVLIVVSLLRWIDHLTRLGRVGETTSRVEQAARRAIEQRLQEPYLGGAPWCDPERAPPSATPLRAQAIGYMQHIDMAALARCGKTLDADIFVPLNPGAFVYPDSVVAWVVAHDNGADAAGALDGMLAAFAIGDERDFDQDPRFGLAVMSEIGSRALSAAINDTGTVIDVIGRTTRLLSVWAQGSEAVVDAEATYPRVHVAALRTEDLFEDAFLPLARDGAGLIEVQLRLRKSLLALARMGDEEFRSAARHQADVALRRAEAVLTLEGERARLREVSELP